jgi:sirohydrochlorin cobaltochelatase
MIKNMKKKTLAVLFVCAVSIGIMAGCGEKAANSSAALGENAEAAEDDGENYETGDADLDNTRNQNDIGEKELLVVSFGTSYNDNRRLAIGAIEQAMDEKFGEEYSVRRGFTSQIIIDHVKKRDNVSIDNVKEALDRALDNGVKTLVVQPTHLMNGLEYQDLEKELSGYADAFEKVALGKPLLSSSQDYIDVMKAVTDETAKYDDGKTAICLMGHGTEADSNEVYRKMQSLLTENGFNNYYVGTVEAEPTLEDVIAKVKEGNYKRVILRPLMIVAGDHANNDMAGDGEDTWKSRFRSEGFEVECVMEGLGQIPAIRDIIVKHAKEAADTLAHGSEMRQANDAEPDGMSPVMADQIKDGVYDVEVDSSSAMFNITECSLAVQEGKMTAVMTMGGTGYLYVFMGTASEAAQASASKYISFKEKSSGEHAYTIPVEALDKSIACAAFSRKREKWYDRALVFRAASLPDEAWKEGEKADGSGEQMKLEDGEYSVKATLEGGSGKAGIESPAKLTVKDGEAYARIVWSSGSFDYMIVDGKKYVNESTEGNSVFTVPVSGLKHKIPVTADTTAMSTPHEIEYDLYFELAE